MHQTKSASISKWLGPTTFVSFSQFRRKNSWKIETFKNDFVRKNNEDATLTPNVLLTNVGLSPKR